MGLLSGSDLIEIRDAIRSVTDTFAITPITYYIGGDSRDRWQEDREEKYFYHIELNALREDKGTTVNEDTDGSENLKEIKLTFNLDYLQGKGLIDSKFKVAFDPTKDYFKVKNEIFKVNMVRYDGPLTEKDVLVIVTGTLRNYSNRKFSSIPLPKNFKP